MDNDTALKASTEKSVELSMDPTHAVLKHLKYRRCDDEYYLSRNGLAALKGELLAIEIKQVAYATKQEIIADTRLTDKPQVNEVEKLQRFKDYVHKRLDDAGIPANPEGENSKHGCRIGDRLDIALVQPSQQRGDWQKTLKDKISFVHYDRMPQHMTDESMTIYAEAIYDVISPCLHPTTLDDHKLVEAVARAASLLHDMIDGGEECRGRDSEISEIIRILEGQR